MEVKDDMEKDFTRRMARGLGLDGCAALVEQLAQRTK